MERRDLQPDQNGYGAVALDGLRVFMVEDEALVAMQLEDMLLDAGCTIAGMAMRLDKARALLERSEAPDLAILDVNVNGEKVFGLAQQFCDRGVPILFATGYGREGLTDAWKDRPVLQKPYTEAQLVQAIRSALNDAEPQARR